jgi:hypothetical protein
MTPDELAAANQRIATPVVSELVGSQRLGFYVVGALARRLDAEVMLRHAPVRGTVVTIVFAGSLFVPGTLIEPIDSIGPGAPVEPPQRVPVTSVPETLDRGTPPGPPPFPDRTGVHTSGPIPLPLSARAADPDLADGSLPRRRPAADPAPGQTLTDVGWQPDVVPAAPVPDLADPATDVTQAGRRHRRARDRARGCAGRPAGQVGRGDPEVRNLAVLRLPLPPGDAG